MPTPTYTRDPTYRGLMAEVLTNPGDDTPRLILADWLEETDSDPARAEFIRESIAGMEYDPFTQGVDVVGAFGETKVGWCEAWGNCVKYKDSVLLSVDRGFVWRAASSASSWKKYGRRLIRQHPITFVRLSDKAPLRMQFVSVWFRWFADHTRSLTRDSRLPAYLSDHIYPHNLMQQYESEEAAHADLSLACLDWAKNQSSIDNPRRRR